MGGADTILWISIKLGGHAHGIVTKLYTNSLPGMKGSRGWESRVVGGGKGDLGWGSLGLVGCSNSVVYRWWDLG